MRTKAFFVAALIAALTSSAFATHLAYEGFDYPSGNLTGNLNTDTATTWTSFSGSGNSPAQVLNGSGSLSVPGFTGAQGGYVSLAHQATSAEDTRVSFTAVLMGSNPASIFYSGLVKVKTSASPFDYCLALNITTDLTSHRGRLCTKSSDTNPLTHFNIGLEAGASGDPEGFATTEFPYNTTVFCIVEYVNIPAALDQVNLWLSTDLSTAPPVQGTPALTVTQGATGTEKPYLDGIFIRQGTASSQTIDVDELRVGTTWSDVMPSAGVSDWSIY